MGELVRLRKNEKNSKPKYTKFLSSFPKLTPGSIVVMFICLVLMVIATFTMVPVGLFNTNMLIDPYSYFSNFNNIVMTLFTKMYTPQIPIAIFTGALLGPRLGTMAMSIYVGLGLIGVPIFASGSGLSIIKEPTFGFILGFIFAAYIVGKFFTLKVNSMSIILAAISGVLAVHFIGDCYLITNLLLSGYSIESIKESILGLSLLNLPYDIILGIILCCIARPIKGFLWLAMD